MKTEIDLKKRTAQGHAHNQADEGNCSLRHSCPLILNCVKLATKTDHQTSSGPEFHIPSMYRIKLPRTKLPTHELW